jgi:hypothetical protein
MSYLGPKTTPYLGLAVNSPLATDAPSAGFAGFWQYDENFSLIDNAIMELAQSGGGTSVEVNGSTVDTPNFNNAAPAAPEGYVNVLWQVNGSEVSGYVPTGGGGFVDPMTEVGDMIYYTASLGATALHIGSAGEVLTVVDGLPAWTAAGGGSYLPLTVPAGTTTVSCGTDATLNFQGGSETFFGISGFTELSLSATTLSISSAASLAITTPFVETASLVLSGPAVMVFGSQVCFGNGVATSATAGSASLPAAPVGFLEITIDFTTYKIPYYAA